MGFDQTLPGARNGGMQDKGYNYLMSVGLLPGLEINGRLATQDNNCNFFYGECKGRMMRDVAASFKAGHSVQLSQGLWLSGSVGVTDYGGEATLNRAYYAVSGLETASWGAHLGGAKRVTLTSPLHGLFGGAQWRPLELLALSTDFIGKDVWLGAKAFVPAQWTPWSNARLHVGLQHALNATTVTPRLTFNAGLTLQLGTHQDTQSSRRISVPGVVMDAAQSSIEQARELLAIPLSRLTAQGSTAAAHHIATEAPTPPEVATGERVHQPLSSEAAAALAEQLSTAGFEDIHVGVGAEGHTVVRFENTLYRWNDLDALGAALAHVIDASDAAKHQTQAPLELQLSRLGIVTARLKATPSCFWFWLHQQPCAPSQDVTIKVGQRSGWWRDDDGVSWKIKGSSPSFGRVVLRLAPGLDYRVGTEYGTLDATVGVNLVAQAPLWKGAHLDVAHIVPLYNTDDYQPGRYYSEFRILNRTHRMLFHQAADLGMGISARMAAGRVGTRYQGAMAETLWQPGDGTHRLGYQWAHFDSMDGYIGKRTSMLHYRYFIRPLQTAVELYKGQFWNTDKGWAINVKHWFDDVSVSTYYRTSRFAPEAAFLSAYGSADVHAVGIEFSFPFTPRKEWTAGPLRMGFADRLSLGLESTVRMNGTNYLIPYHGRFPPVPLSLGGVAYNFDRMSRSYLEDNAHLIRAAFHTYSQDVKRDPGP